VLSSIIPNSEVRWSLLFPSKDQTSKKEKKHINYSLFLAQFYLKLDNKKLTEWRDDVVKALVASIVSKEQTLVSAFKEYDTSKDGLLSFTEFWEAMEKYVGKLITERQCHELMQSIDQNKDGFIDYPEFRFTFSGDFDKFNSTSDKIKDAVTAITREIILIHGKIDGSFQKLFNNAEQVKYREFAHVLKNELSNVGVEQDVRKQLFGYIALNGVITEKAFKSAFKEDKRPNRRIQFESNVKSLLLDHLCDTVRRYKPVLSDIWSDTDKNGHISKAEFTDAFKALNEHLEILKEQNLSLEGPATTDGQIEKLYSILETDKEKGWIDYHKFLDMFVVHFPLEDKEPENK